MSNSNFSHGGQDDDFDKYIAEEILEYYGEDFVNSVGSPPPVPPDTPRKRRRKKLYSLLSAVCAVVFLTGAVILTGAVFGGNFLPHSTQPTGSSSVTESYIDNPMLTSGDSDSERTSSRQTSNEGVGSSVSSKASSQAESDSISSKASSQVESSSVSSKASSQVESSSVSSKASSQVESDSASSKASSQAESSHVSSKTSSQTKITSSNVDVFSQSSNANSFGLAQGTADTSSVISRDRDYSLPSIADDGALTSVHTDYDNNSITNPNDNVTTGRPLRAGVGVSLMIMSLAVSLILNKLREQQGE